MHFPRFRPRLRLRTLLIAVAVATGVATMVWYVRLVMRAESYGLAAERYAEYATGYESSESFTGRGFSSCYGRHWEDYSEEVLQELRTHAADRAYRDARAAHYRGLERKYIKAAEEPWHPIPLDPPLAP
jgi:hypothetical protein